MVQVVGLVLFVFLFGDAFAQNQPKSGDGTASPSGRIVNGTDVSIVNHPFVVGLYYAGSFYCGGSVITHKHVLSAGHCFAGEPDPGLITVRAGSTNLYEGKVFPIFGYRQHPSFSFVSGDYDAAIVTISGTFEGNANIAPIPLQTTELTYSANNPTWCYVVGWGYVNAQSSAPWPNLQLIWMQIISQYSCMKKWGDGDAPISSRMMCAQMPNTDACRGDSGGPLVCNRELTGIVSWGDAFCTGSLPSVFAKVSQSSIRAFIKEVTGV